MTSQPGAGTAKRTMTLERTFKAPIEDVWALWTTKEGIESWWGPEGFSVKVHEIDLRPGGVVRYAMTATAPEQIAFMQQAGMPLTTESAFTFSEIVAQERLVFTHLVDFVPEVKAYNTTTKVEFSEGPQGVQMVLTLQAMHDETWTKMAVMGWESQLGKLDQHLASR